MTTPELPEDPRLGAGPDPTLKTVQDSAQLSEPIEAKSSTQAAPMGSTHGFYFGHYRLYSKCHTGNPVLLG